MRVKDATRVVILALLRNGNAHPDLEFLQFFRFIGLLENVGAPEEKREPGGLGGPGRPILNPPSESYVGVGFPRCPSPHLPLILGVAREPRPVHQVLVPLHPGKGNRLWVEAGTPIGIHHQVGSSRPSFSARGVDGGQGPSIRIRDTSGAPPLPRTA